MRELHITSREMQSMLMEKSFILIIIMEFLLVSSSGLLSVGYAIFTSPESSSTLSRLSNLIYVGVITDSKELIEPSLRYGKLHYTYYESFAVANNDFKEGLIDAVIVGDIQEGKNPSVIQIHLASNSPKTPLTKLAIKKVLTHLEESIRNLKVRVFAPDLKLATYRIMKFNPLAHYTEIYYVFTLPLLLFLPCVVSGSLTIDSITQDLESKRILNLIVTPLRSYQIILGKSLASFILSIFQSVLWLFILSITVVSPSNILLLIILAVLYTVIFMNVGSIIALYLRKNKNSQIIYTFFSMTAISLFSPFANYHPLLLQASPAYLITRLSLGASPIVFTPQFVAISLLAVGSSLFLGKLSSSLNRI